MIDGLALGETTPGPLIMVVAFVGFVGAWTKALLGPDALAARRHRSARASRRSSRSCRRSCSSSPAGRSSSRRATTSSTAPLAAITAAVVGVIVNLAVFFGVHVFWPAGLAGPVDPRALAIAVLAAIALFRFQRHVIEVILVCATLGALITSLA